MFADAQGRVQRVGAYAVCRDDQRRLLVCRLTAETGRPGWWTIPGGGVDFGEHPSAAVVREVREETGYEVLLGDLLAVDSLARTALVAGADVEYHAVRVVYRATVIGGGLRHETGNSTDQAAWMTAAELAATTRNELLDFALAL